MKKITFTTLIALPLCLASSYGQVLLAGWDGTNKAAPGLTGTTITSSYALTSGAFVLEGYQGIVAADTGLWGTTAATPASSTGVGTFTWFDVTSTVNVTLTNTGTSDISLDTAHINARRDGSNSATGATISFVSSTDTDLTAGAGTFLAFGGIGGGYDGYDQSLATVFGGTNLLSAGETVVLAWTFDTSARVRLDNLAISTVPEPSSVALLGLAGLALIARRRR